MNLRAVIEDQTSHQIGHRGEHLGAGTRDVHRGVVADGYGVHPSDVHIRGNSRIVRIRLSSSVRNGPRYPPRTIQARRRFHPRPAQFVTEVGNNEVEAFVVVPLPLTGSLSCTGLRYRSIVAGLIATNSSRTLTL